MHDIDTSADSTPCHPDTRESFPLQNATDGICQYRQQVALDRTTLPRATAECNQRTKMFEPDKAADAACSRRAPWAYLTSTFLPSASLPVQDRPPSQLHIRLLQSGRNHVQLSSKARIANLVRLFAHHGSVVVARPATTRRASPFQWIFSSSGSPHCASTQLFGTSRGWHRTTMATSPDFPSAQLLEKKARVTVQWLLRNGRGDRWLM